MYLRSRVKSERNNSASLKRWSRTHVLTRTEEDDSEDDVAMDVQPEKGMMSRMPSS